jgi:hypothetical protein
MPFKTSISRPFLFKTAIIAVGIMIFLVGSYLSRPEAKTKSLSPTNKCAEMVLQNYLRLGITLSNRQMEAELNRASTIDFILAKRRLEEDFCMKFAKCNLIGISEDMIALVYSTEFYSCLRDEATENFKHD